MRNRYERNLEHPTDPGADWGEIQMATQHKVRLAQHDFAQQMKDCQYLSDSGTSITSDQTWLGITWPVIQTNDRDVDLQISQCPEYIVVENLNTTLVGGIPDIRRKEDDSASTHIAPQHRESGQGRPIPMASSCFSI